MSDQKPTDKAAFEQLIRGGQRANKVNWTPIAGQADTDALNRAIRRASGRDDPEEGGEPFPWKNLGGGDEKGST